MIRALVVKELRESAAVVALAAAYILAELWGVRLHPWSSAEPRGFSFFQDGFWDYLALLGPSLAIVLAMKQTQWEDAKGTFPYLLFRPTTRREIFLLKLAVGGALVAGVTALMILLHGVWAAVPGHQAFPFFWSMTIPSWQLWFTLPLVYSAAFLCGVRPGRWYGSKLLPLVGGGALALILCTQPWWWIALVGSALGSAMCVGCALHVAATRDY